MIRSSAASVVSFFLLQQHVSSSSSCYDLVMNDDWGGESACRGARVTPCLADGWGPDPAAVVTITSTNLNASLSDGTTATENICLEDGCYTLRVSKDEYPAEVSWTFGETLSGGANSTTNFTAISGTIVAGCTCSEMRMYDDWGGTFNECCNSHIPTQMAGGSLNTQLYEARHQR